MHCTQWLPRRNTSLVTTPGMSGLPQDSLLTCGSVARVQQPRSSPDNGPGLGVLSCRVDGGHQRYTRHITNVVVDGKLEVGEFQNTRCRWFDSE